MPPAFFDPVSSVLHGIARRFGLEAKLLEHRLREQWPEIVGEHVAAHTRPDQIRFKKLSLIAETSVWLQQLTYLKPMLIEKINHVAGGALVTDIVLRVGEITGDVGESKMQNEKGKIDEREPTLESVAQAEAHAACLKDPDLRARLAAVMAQALSSRTDRRPP
jgi:hypothetical protein